MKVCPPHLPVDPIKNHRLTHRHRVRTSTNRVYTLPCQHRHHSSLRWGLWGGGAQASTQLFKRTLSVFGPANYSPERSPSVISPTHLLSQLRPVSLQERILVIERVGCGRHATHYFGLNFS